MPPSSQAAYQSLQDFNNNRKSATDITTEAQNQYDIPGYTSRLSTLRGLVGNLTSSVNAVDPSVTGRTSGSFVTEGQRSALVNKERAPILSDLGTEQNALGTEQTGFNTASGLASQLASSVLSQDQTKYQSLLDQYNGAVASEQAAEQKRQYEADLAEKQREFNAQQAAASAASSGGGYNLGTLGDTGGGGSTTDQGIQQRADKGFNFMDTAGHGINAFQYAQGHNIPFRTLLQQMASKGDSGAVAGLQFIGNDGNADPTKVTNQNLANLYHALTGRWVAVQPLGPYSPSRNVGSVPAFSANPNQQILGIPGR
jgi:hypothetical protein